MTDLATHRQKKSKQCPGKNCRCSNSAFLHGVEWDRLIVHRTHQQWKRTISKPHGGDSGQSIICFNVQSALAIKHFGPISNGNKCFMDIGTILIENKPKIKTKYVTKGNCFVPGSQITVESITRIDNRPAIYLAPGEPQSSEVLFCEITIFCLTLPYTPPPPHFF